MNLYFVVEGKTEKAVYPQWLNHLLPQISKVNFACDATENNYFLISGNGFPSIFDYLRDAVDEINEFKSFDYLILALDADDMTVEDKINEVYEFIEANKITLHSSCQFKVIAHKFCMETWFLGNRKVFPRSSDDIEFKPHFEFYDVSKNDPELMNKPDSFHKSISIYHEAYLRKMLAVKNITYSKSKPKEVGELHYLNELKKRVVETGALPSLQIFLDFCATLLNPALSNNH